ncbi:hypothetical protein [Fibrobacter sp.]|uniref:hypothetical protein n=1 Tax=Fibrobacter sp. TaxID=35828 RepID=UPI00388D5A4A
MSNKILILYPQTNKHLGLWNDLLSDDRAMLMCAGKKKLDGFLLFLFRIYFKFHRRLKCLPLHRCWFEYSELYKKVKMVDHLVVVDGALNTVELYELRRCRQINPNLKVSLYFINSMDANSPIMIKVRPKIKKFNWDNIYTFDKHDAEKYGYAYAGFMYYSKHELANQPNPKYDVHFVGGVKGGREELINATYSFLEENGIDCDFNLMIVGGQPCKRKIDGISYFSGGWLPYEHVLSKVNDSRCILEICQQGQNGATLRYFEAVCYNKKLLTNNPNVKNFPFYNPQFVKVFDSPSEIDVNWLKEDVAVNYGYQDEFSPRHLVDFILG